MTNLLPDIPWFVYAMLLAPVGLLVFAAAYKYLEVQAASDWPSVTGKVVISKPEVRDVKVIDGNREEGHHFEKRNFANVTYEYVIAGQAYRNNRVTIGEDRGNFEVAETLARYPAGKAVTVYYNPNRRSEAVLERDMPKGIWGCLGWMVAIAVVGVFGSAIGFHELTEFVSTQMAHPQMSAMTVALGAFGAVIALFAIGLHRHAALARTWPVVKGTIRTSGLERFRASADASGARGPIMFTARISYTYRYERADYTGLVASMNGQVSSTSDWGVRRLVRKYPEGAIVDVYVNPQNPSESLLNPRAAAAWFLWVVAGVMWALAYYVATKS